ncbi:hypothetical protein FOXG_18651 [Fusarium oxysporum f. sp. lycopersici 4287]|nr:hypothetical protein FOXG_18651 [Fusarium oxysporum f. sp. lycopersici 4287]XP_018238147.1 hypothetical protein FOXG_18651 [Fusarium oxysporum f. sp. lycopersici 4287]KNB00101.1 hypothetical protein FOXG_18651 [Fusarium oxysporum f. sp. lycopersici 4287]KNB00102.1 hypothetical protein FOXG_18651 [Fusarium oxysporum f. sp. lycopersici 4287]
MLCSLTPWRRPITGSDVSNSEGFLFFCPARLHSRNKATQLEQLLVGFGFATVVCKIRHCKRVRRQLVHGTGGRDAPFLTKNSSIVVMGVLIGSLEAGNGGGIPQSVAG